MSITLTVNGRARELDVAPDMPLLWALRDTLGLLGVKYGCGAGLCGACTVHLDGVAARSCQVATGDVGEQAITTIEGLSPDGSHPVQRAWLAEDVAQFGYCQAGQIMTAAAARWETDRDDCQAELGTVVRRSSGERLTYGELALEAGSQALPDDIPLKPATDFRLIGTATPNVYGPAIANAIFAATGQRVRQLPLSLTLATR